MKKILLFFLLTHSLSAFSQGSFEPQVRASLDVGVDNDKNLSFGADFVAGYRINPNFRAGIGVGVSYVNLLYSEAYVSSSLNYHEKYKESAAYIPIFADAKCNLTTGKVSPFFDVNLGYSVFIPCSDYAKENKLGFFVSPAFGCDFSVGEGKLFAQIGYRYQVRKCDHWDDPNGNYNQITIGVGYQF